MKNIHHIPTRKKSDTQKQHHTIARGLMEACLDPLVATGADGKIMDIYTLNDKAKGAPSIC